MGLWVCRLDGGAVLEENLDDGVNHAAGACGNGSEPLFDLYHEAP